VLTTNLQALLTGLVAGAVLTPDAVLQTLRNDAAYGIDAMKTVVTLTAGDQFVRVSQGGASFTVLPGHRFTVQAVEVTP